MLQRLLPLWQPTPVAVTVLFALLMLGIGEGIAEQCREGDFTAKPRHHVWFATRTFSLPNYWVWYGPEAVYEAIEAQGLAQNVFLGSIVFNAAMCTPAVCFGLIFALMFLLVRVVPPTSKLNDLWVIPVVAFFADLLEDILLLVITLGYPFRKYPALLEILRWCSLVKFVLWMVALVALAVLGLRVLLKGSRLKEEGKAN